MKNLIVIGVIALLSLNLSFAQGAEKKKVKELISTFATAADEQNANKLDGLLDENYRIVMNRQFGSTVVGVMPKSAYLAKIKAKEFGGDKRELKIKKVVVNGCTASALVTYAGQKMTFVSLVNLIQDAGGSWKIISEVPVIQ